MKDRILKLVALFGVINFAVFLSLHAILGVTP